MDPLAIIFLMAVYPLWWGIATEAGRAIVRHTVWRYGSIWLERMSTLRGRANGR